MEAILDDILALIHKRESDLRGELDKLTEVRRVLVNGAEVDATPAAAATVTRRRRSMSPKARKAISKRMKAFWRAQRASK